MIESESDLRESLVKWLEGGLSEQEENRVAIQILTQARIDPEHLSHMSEKELRGLVHYVLELCCQKFKSADPYIADLIVKRDINKKKESTKDAFRAMVLPPCGED